MKNRYLLSCICVLQSFVIFSQEISDNVSVQKLAGPRLGFTILNKALVDKLPDYFDENKTYSPFVTQWGWQFETKFATTSTISGIVEFIPLVGGFEQGLFLPSFNVLMGVRSIKNWELGAGPSITATGTGIVLTGGYNFQSGGLNFPINCAFNFAEGGTRFTILAGFNVRK
ncbi:MAG: hypothetical protein H7X71_07770 [Chitinophagales bacterium]|nr:hypothetical protein [Chitinophagales bacterium]